MQKKRVDVTAARKRGSSNDNLSSPLLPDSLVPIMRSLLNRSMIGDEKSNYDKALVSSPGDSDELEADRIAARLPKLTFNDTADKATTLPLHRSGDIVPQKHGTQLDATTIPEMSHGKSSVRAALESPSQKLNSKSLELFEPFFGRDLSFIRTHTNSVAGASAKALNAEAYTIGSHIVFGKNYYHPDTSEGQRLLAHEIVHTLQADTSHIKRKTPTAQVQKPPKEEDEMFATQKALEIAKLIKSDKWKPEYGELLGHWLEFFKGMAWAQFTTVLKYETGKDIEEYRGNEQKRTDFEGSEVDATLVIPIGKPEVVTGGFTVAYFAQILDETSDSTSVEVYTDVSASAGLSLEVPLEVAKFKIGGEAKRGRKESEKHEEKKARRKGRTITRSFTIHKLGREVFNQQYKKIFYGAGPIANKVEHEKGGYGVSTQYGYEIVPDQGGKHWGPFWNTYDGYMQDEKSQAPEIWRILYREQRVLAEDLVLQGY